MKKFILLILVLSFLSCVNNQKKEVKTSKKDIIPEETMVALLVDIHFIEAELFIKQNNGKDIKYYTKYYYSFLTSKYDITYFQFCDNISYYSSRTEEFEKIYEQVLNTISQKSGEIYKK
jgi:hypothetical protein